MRQPGPAAVKISTRLEPAKRTVYSAASDLPPGSYEWVLKQDEIDNIMKKHSGHARRVRASKHACEQEGDAMLRLLRMKISVKDVGEIAASCRRADR